VKNVLEGFGRLAKDVDIFSYKHQMKLRWKRTV